MIPQQELIQNKMAVKKSYDMTRTMNYSNIGGQQKNLQVKLANNMNVNIHDSCDTWESSGGGGARMTVTKTPLLSGPGTTPYVVDHLGNVQSPSGGPVEGVHILGVDRQGQIVAGIAAISHRNNSNGEKGNRDGSFKTALDMKNTQ